MSAVLKNPLAQRDIALRTRGQRHGPITRLVSPSEFGEIIKPFVFLDLFDIAASSAPNFGWHPHSGIATLTVLHEGAIEYQETTGVNGILPAGGILNGCARRQRRVAHRRGPAASKRLSVVDRSPDGF